MTRLADKLLSCRTAHDWAVSSICIVVQHAPIKRAWSFPIQSFDLASGAQAPEGAPLAGKATGAEARSVTPLGNTGGTSSRSVIHV